MTVGIRQGGQEQHAYYGVTSIDNLLPVDETRTHTATAAMRLVEQEQLSLDAARPYLGARAPPQG